MSIDTAPGIPKTHVVILAIVAGLLFFAFDYCGDFALNDDWGYSTPVRWWAEQRQLALTHWQTMPLVTQVLSGMIWSEIFGFSQCSMRQLTLVFALIAAVSAYGIARLLLLPAGLCLIGALLVLASPVFLGLSYTFMTDVPAAAFMALSVLFFLRSLHKEDGGTTDYIIGAVFLILAVLLRQTALAIALAMIVADLVARGFSTKRLLRGGLVLGLVVLAYVLCNDLLRQNFGQPSAYDAKNDAIAGFVNDILAAKFGALRTSFRAVVKGSAHFGLYVLPLAPIIWTVFRVRGWKPVVIAAGLAAVLVLASVWLRAGVMFPAVGDVLSSEGIGPRHIEGVRPPAGILALILTGLGHFSTICCIWIAARVIVSPGKPDWVAHAGARGGVLLVALSAALYYAPHTIVYAPIFDRYAAVAASLLALAALRMVVTGDAVPQSALRASGILVALGFALSLMLVADFFRWQEARYALIARLEKTGVSINGGFEYNNLTAIVNRPDDAVSMLRVDPSDREVTLTKTPAPDADIVAIEEFQRIPGFGRGRIYAVR